MGCWDINYTTARGKLLITHRWLARDKEGNFIWCSWDCLKSKYAVVDSWGCRPGLKSGGQFSLNADHKMWSIGFDVLATSLILSSLQLAYTYWLWHYLGRLGRHHSFSFATSAAMFGGAVSKPVSSTVDHRDALWWVVTLRDDWRWMNPDCCLHLLEHELDQLKYLARICRLGRFELQMIRFVFRVC